jgi:hypothetical protein
MRYGFIVICALLGGCVAAEDKNLISTGAAVGQGNLREWDTLSPKQQYEAHENLVGAMCVLDYDINDKPLPSRFVETAPVTSEAH